MAGEDVYVPPRRIGFKPLGASEASRADAVVAKALRAFGLDGYATASFTKHSNLTARLVRANHPSLALRLRTEPAVDGRTEYEWLTAVRRSTTVRTVKPYADTFTDNTRVVTDFAGRGVECALFYWAEGSPLAANLSETNYRELGRITAELHEFASRWEAPVGLRPLVWDRVLYYEGTRLVILDAKFREFVSAKDAEAVELVVGLADEELRRLSTEVRAILLHGNIEMWNVLTTAPGKLRLLDFEDVMLGAPVLDVVVSLYGGRERDDYLSLCRAYESGYESVREWPVQSLRQLDLLTAARATMLLNHALQTESDKRSVTDRLLPLILAAAP